MNFKKLLLLLVLCLLPLTLIACGDKDKEGDPGTDPNPTNNPYPIGLDIEVSKKEYALNEDFVSSLDKAEVVYSDYTRKDVKGSVNINNQKFNKTKDGVYEIIITFEEKVNNVNYLVKSFYLAKVGSGQSSGGGSGGGGDQVFGPGTYTFDGTIDLKNYEKGQEIKGGTAFAGGYFVLKGTNAKRANAEIHAIELAKEEGSWIEFVVNGVATVSVVCSSTGGSNTSAIAIFDSENQLVTNHELKTMVSGTTQQTLTYTLVSGTYRILSQAHTENSNRGVRVYKVIVTQGQKQR